MKLLLPMQGKPGALSLRLNLYTWPNSLQAQQRESSASDSNGVSPYVSNDVFIWSTLLLSPRHAQTGSPFMKEKCRVIFLSAKLARGFICSVGSAKPISLRRCAGSEPQGRSKWTPVCPVPAERAAGAGPPLVESRLCRGPRVLQPNAEHPWLCLVLFVIRCFPRMPQQKYRCLVLRSSSSLLEADGYFLVVVVLPLGHQIWDGGWVQTFLLPVTLLFQAFVGKTVLLLLVEWICVHTGHMYVWSFSDSVWVLIERYLLRRWAAEKLEVLH